MSPRYIAAIIAMVAALGGAVAIANPSALGLRSIAQAPTASPVPVDRGPDDRGPMSPNPTEPGWLKELNLSADQVRQMRAIRNQYKDKIAQSRQSARQSQQELRALMAGDASDEQIRTKYSQVQTLRAQAADTQFESILATRKVLTPEQRRMAANRIMKQHDRRPERDQPPQG